MRVRLFRNGVGCGEVEIRHPTRTLYVMGDLIGDALVNSWRQRHEFRRTFQEIDGVWCYEFVRTEAIPERKGKP